MSEIDGQAVPGPPDRTAAISTDQSKAYAYGLAAVLIWSTVAAAFKFSLSHLDVFQLVLYSCLTSILALSFLLILTNRIGIVFSFSKKQYLHSLILGFMNPFLYYLVLFKAYDLLPAQEAQPLNYIWAVTLALLSVPILGQKITRRDITGAVVCYGGVLVIATRGDVLSLEFSDPLGVGLALGSTLIWALYWLISAGDDRDPAAGLLLNFLFSLPFALGACLLFSSPVVRSPIGLAGAAYVGIFEMGLTFVLWLMAMKHTKNTAKISNLIFISPPISLFLIHFLVGETIFISTYIGLTLILGGLFLQHKRA